LLLTEYDVQLLNLVYSIIALHGPFYGTGMHFRDITRSDAAIALRDWYICEVLIGPLSGLVRTSVGIFLLQITPVNIYRIIIYSNLVVVWIMSFVFLFTTMFQCSPVPFFWERVLGLAGTCLDDSVIPNMAIAQSVVNGISDLVLAILPIFLLWNIQMKRQRKVSVAVLLSLGIL
jgi:hypothetical protein